jgi:hypothetical protein
LSTSLTATKHKPGNSEEDDSFLAGGSQSSASTPLGEKALGRMLEEKKKQIALTAKRSRKEISPPSPDKNSKKAKSGFTKNRFIETEAEASGSDGTPEEDEDNSVDGFEHDESGSDLESSSSQRQFDAKHPPPVKSISTGIFSKAASLNPAGPLTLAANKAEKGKTSVRTGKDTCTSSV